MPTEYSQDDALQKAVTDLIARPELHELGALRDNEIKVLTCFCLKTNKDGEEQKAQSDPVKLKKVTPVEAVWIPAHFMLVVDYPTWNEASPKQQEILLFDALTYIEVTTTDGILSLAKSKPVLLNPRTIIRYGAHTEALNDVGRLLIKGSERFAEQLEGQEQT